jgi:hypothetical protein
LFQTLENPPDMLTKRRRIIYYLLFVLCYTSLYFVTGMILFNYEDTADVSDNARWTFSSMSWTEKIAYIVWYVPEFPLGFLADGPIKLLLCCLVNPGIIGWFILKFARNRKYKVATTAIWINGSIAAVLVLTVVIFIIVY